MLYHELSLISFFFFSSHALNNEKKNDFKINIAPIDKTEMSTKEAPIELELPVSDFISDRFVNRNLTKGSKRSRVRSKEASNITQY